jgi:hypothetical protein
MVYGVGAVVLIVIGILGVRYQLKGRVKTPAEIQDVRPEDQLSLKEEELLGAHKVEFARWEVTNIPNNGNDVITVKLIDSVSKEMISKKIVTTNNREGRLSVAAIERGIQEAMKDLASKEIAKRNRAAAINTLVHKYNGKEA